MKQRGSQMKWKTVIPRLVAYVAAGAIVVVVISYSALLCVSLFLERVISPAMEPPEHHIVIDKVEPEVPGLELMESKGSIPSRMDLMIINHTDQEVSVIDPQTNDLIVAKPEKEGGEGPSITKIKTAIGYSSYREAVAD